MEIKESPKSITVRIFDIKENKVRQCSSGFEDPLESFKSLRHYQCNYCTEILAGSKLSKNTIPSSNGFVKTVVDCYNYHHNLVIRPDDIWAAIMTQFSFYVNGNAEELRGKFVNFEGKKQLTVNAGGSLRNASYDVLVNSMTDEIHKNLVDPEVKEWILPNFSTTTENDLVSIGVIFMATMKKYFEYKFSMLCGIPCVTLEGTVEDWENIYKRLEKLKSHKLEEWHGMLEQILKQFVETRKGNVDLEFWQRICSNHSGGSGGSSYISGWITAFCAFDEDGKWQGGCGIEFNETQDGVEIIRLPLGGKYWPKIDTDKIPTGIEEVDVKIYENGTEHNTVMLAGHLGFEVLEDEVTLKPTLGWVIALRPSQEEVERLDEIEIKKMKHSLYGFGF